MKRIIGLSLWLISGYLLAQTSPEGQITNVFGIPIQEANILNLRTEKHTHSNDQGRFTLEGLHIGDYLRISFLGYETQNIQVQELGKPLYIVLKEKSLTLNEVIITPNSQSLKVITDIDIETNPVTSSQDILRKVPGLIIGQHAGGGKAEQIFLRGFDIDHGTDINIAVDGMPVNMVSHAHGQGYADLHFVIPETVEKIDFGKGTYNPTKGNFATAGYIDFMTKTKLNYSTLKLEAGEFGTYRTLGMFDLLNGKNRSLYLATELLSTKGFFNSSQNFDRLNIFGKFTGKVNQHDNFSLTFSHFNSQWDASGQIPQRAVDKGLIGRFGAIDDTEGGQTARTNMQFSYDKKVGKQSFLISKGYLTRYDFELYSNFTFFANDFANGDQIKQKENRVMYGLNSTFVQTFSEINYKGSWQIGMDLRNDKSKNNELSRTKNRKEILAQIRLGDINETNLGAHVGLNLEMKKWVFEPSVRVDYFDYQYYDKLQKTYETQQQDKARISPKFNLMYNATEDLQLYLKSGIGFHSNDTRVILDKIKRTEILPAAYSVDLGYIWKPTDKLLINMACWLLYLEQEFVYVGDEGIVEPSGKTLREGLDISVRYQPFTWLFWNIDANYTLARATEEKTGEDYIPLAPDFTLTNGINIKLESGVFGSLQLRHIGDRPANETNSIVAKGYTITDLNMGYKWDKISLGIQIKNLLNTEWNETQFATQSRLKTELSAVEEIHFTPGTPRFVKAMVEFTF